MIAQRVFKVTVEPSDEPQIQIAIDRNGEGFTITWPVGGILQSSHYAEGPYEDLEEAASPFQSSFDRNRFFRIKFPTAPLNPIPNIKDTDFSQKVDGLLGW